MKGDGQKELSKIYLENIQIPFIGKKNPNHFVVYPRRS